MSESTLRYLPGYPFLPCPICQGTESCDHTLLERAHGAGFNVHVEKRRPIRDQLHSLALKSRRKP